MMNTKLIKNFILYFSIILIISAYFLFIKHSTVTCGMITDKQSNGNYYSLKILYNKEIKNVYISKKYDIPNATAYSFELNGFFVKSVTPCKEVQGKVYAVSSKSIEIDDSTYSFSSSVQYYDMKTKPVYSSRVLPGFSCYNFVFDKNNKIALVFVKTPQVSTVRVGISTSDLSTLNHTKEIDLSSKGGFILSYLDKSITINKPAKLAINQNKDGGIDIAVSTKPSISSKEYSGASNIVQNLKNRIFIKSNNIKYAMLGDSLKRLGSYVPEYYGTMEFYAKDKNIRIVNEVDIEQYLKYVVPSEMLSIGGVEGYKVQAVAARTYVLWDMLTGRFAQSGFHVTDTTLCQVYNNQPSSSDCSKAVDATKGIIMTYGNSIIDAKYYSTSCGVGAPYNEIWYKGNDDLKPNTEPYLDFQNYSTLNVKSLSNENDAIDFLKDWTVKAYDSYSQYFRWKFTEDKKTITASFNSKIYDLSVKNPDAIKRKFYFGIYVKPKFTKPSPGTTTILGDITDINVTKRGAGGNVMEIVFTCEKGTYKVKGESLIKYLLVPLGDSGFNIKPLYGNDFTGQHAFPSGFYVIDKQLSSDKIKSITIYGGGFGHGAGMSQYGAIGLVRVGKNYEEILKAYYKGINFSNYEDVVKSKF